MTAPDQPTAVAKRQQDYVEQAKGLLAFEAKDDAQAQWAVDVARQLADVSKTWKAEKEAITRPLHEAHRAACAHFGQPLRELEEIRKHLKGTADAFYVRKAEEQRAALAEAAAAQNPAQIQAAVEIVTERPKGLSGKDHYYCRIVDASLVPREWCCPDMVLLNARAQEQEAAFVPPPGVEVVVERRTTLR